MKSRLRVFIAGGGTGGHILPALAIGRELRDQHAAEVRFVGTSRGMETRLVPEAGFPLDLINVGQLNNVSLATRAKTMLDLPRAVVRCLFLLRRFKPHVVVGVGGYASGPAMVAAILLRIPTLAFEPNAIPGMANRLIGGFLSAAAVNFAEAGQHLRHTEVTGIPVRPEFFTIPPRPAGPPQHLLLLGGSQGARALNEALPLVAVELLRRFPQLTITHQAGDRHADTTQAAYEQAGVDLARVQVTAFLNTVVAIAEADLLLCRSGASTVAELYAAGRPALFVPFPQAADDHQSRNAEAMQRAGAAEVLAQREMTPERLLTALTGLLSKPARLRDMSESARAQAHPEALRRIAAKVVGLADLKG